jgi:hypothetical protein
MKKYLYKYKTLFESMKNYLYKSKIVNQVSSAQSQSIQEKNQSKMLLGIMEITLKIEGLSFVTFKSYV